MSKTADDERALALCEWIAKAGIEGVGELPGAQVLAEKYASNADYPTPEARIDALIKNEFAPNAIKAAIPGLSQQVPFSKEVPAEEVSTCVRLAQRVAAIALLAGKVLNADALRAQIIACLLRKEIRATIIDEPLPGPEMLILGMKILVEMLYKKIKSNKVLRTLSKILVPWWIQILWERRFLNCFVFDGGPDGADYRSVGECAKKVFLTEKN